MLAAEMERASPTIIMSTLEWLLHSRVAFLLQYWRMLIRLVLIAVDELPVKQCSILGYEWIVECIQFTSTK